MDRAALIRDSIQQIARLRADGPTTIDYLRWRDATAELLVDMLGPEHSGVRAFREAVGPGAPGEAEGLQIQGQHGMLPRLEQAETALRGLLGEEG